jgi:hypothetical protein
LLVVRGVARPNEAERTRIGVTFLAALAVLVVNDHVLKGGGALPGWLTGKLSDVAGLVVAPTVLAVLLRARTGRGRALAIAAVSAVFAAIKVSRSAASALEAVMAAVGVPWRLWADPTDLVALGVLPFTWRAMAPAGAPPPHLWHRLGVIAGGAACVATSVACTGAARSIINEAHEEIAVAIYEPAGPLDCAALAADPKKAAELTFNFSRCQRVAPFEGVHLGRNNDPCGATVIARPGLAATVVFWTGLPTTCVSDVGEADDPFSGHLFQLGERFYLEAAPTMSVFVLPTPPEDANRRCAW